MVRRDRRSVVILITVTDADLADALVIYRGRTNVFTILHYILTLLHLIYVKLVESFRCVPFGLCLPTERRQSPDFIGCSTRWNLHACILNRVDWGDIMVFSW